jgi:hypothetical protein
MQQAVIPKTIILGADIPVVSPGNTSSVTPTTTLLDGSPVTLVQRASRAAARRRAVARRGGLAAGGPTGITAFVGTRGAPGYNSKSVLAVDLSFTGTYAPVDAQVVHALGGFLIPPTLAPAVKSWRVRERRGGASPEGGGAGGPARISRLRPLLAASVDPALLSARCLRTNTEGWPRWQGRRGRRRARPRAPRQRHHRQ